MLLNIKLVLRRKKAKLTQSCRDSLLMKSSEKRKVPEKSKLLPNEILIPVKVKNSQVLNTKKVIEFSFLSSNFIKLIDNKIC